MRFNHEDFYEIHRMKFDSKKDLLFSTVILGINAFLIGVAVFAIVMGDMDKEGYLALILIFAVVGLVFWLYYGTRYELTKENGLKYRSGPFKGKIAVDRI